MRSLLILSLSILNAITAPTFCWSQTDGGKKLPERDLHAEGTHPGGLAEDDRKWIKEIQDKHFRIEQQLADQKQGKAVEIERYTAEEMDAGIATEIIAGRTIRLQLERDGKKPIPPEDAVARFKKLLASRPGNKYVAEAKKQRLTEISLRLKDLPTLKAELKRATVSADDTALKKATESLESWRVHVLSLMEKPLCEQNFNLEFKEGQILRIENPDLKILQVTDKLEGKAIVHHKFSSRFKSFYVVGMDLKNIVDGSRFPTGRTFVVRGTTTYATAAGGTNTVFELQEVTNDLAFSDAETKDAREAVQHALDVDLTKEEQDKVTATQRLKQKQMQDAKAAKDAEQAKKDADAKAQRAKSFLDLGKSLSSKGNNSGARKQFEKAVAESPDSDAGKEAKALLDVLQKK